MSSQPVQESDHRSRRLRGLWTMLAGFRRRYLAASASLALAATTKTATYLLLAYFIDHVLGNSERGALALPLTALGFVALACFEGGFTFLSGKLAAETAEGITVRLRKQLFDHIQHLTFTYHDQTKTGDLIQRVTSDVDAVRRFYATQATEFGRIIMLFVVNLAALLAINWQLALLSVVVVPFVAATSLYFFNRIERRYESFQEQDAVLSTTLQENLAGVRVVKAFARQEFERERFERDNWEKFVRGKRLLLQHALYWPITDIMCGFQMLAGLLLGAGMVLGGALSIGDYLAYSGMIVWLIWPMRNLGRLIVQMSSGIVSYARVADVLAERQEPLDEGSHVPAGPPQGALSFKQVSFGYDSDARVLRDISFEAAPGQAIALLGPTGSGKTSLVNLLPRFYEYAGGSLTLDGVELNSYPRRYLRQHIGIVEQEPFLFSRTIRDNITYGVGRDVSQAEIEAAAAAAAVHDVILSFPEGYDTLVGEKGVTLSGGQKQRITIARTLLKNPRILILDDSTSAVDSETEASIREAMERLMQGRTTFIIAHRVQSVMNADLILVLDRGSIVQRGTHEQLLAQDGMYRRVYDLQVQIEHELEKEIADVGYAV
ncbi:MAG TPA: ABC transporter ATP-binding protein [Herpetosiphonaceae bacterium]